MKQARTRRFKKVMTTLSLSIIAMMLSVMSAGAASAATPTLGTIGSTVGSIIPKQTPATAKSFAVMNFSSLNTLGSQLTNALFPKG